MAPAVERRDHVSRHASDRSNSPTRGRHSPHRKGSPRRDRPSAHRRSSPKTRSPTRTSSSHKLRSPVKEKLSDRARSPKNERPRSPVRTSSSGSPSPRTKRLRRARAEREVDKDHGGNASKEGRDKGRHSVHGDKRDVSSDRRLVRDKSDAGSMKSSRHDRSISPEERSHGSRRRSHSPPRVSKAGARDEAMNVRAAEQSRDIDRDSVAKMNAATDALEAKEKQKPSFELSGKLAEETNRVRGVTLLFNEPPDARKPDVRWRLYVFKAGEVLNEPLYIHRQSCYLFGRERRVADIPTDHPSCSKQHAVLQYRLVEKEQPDGLLSKQPRICTIARELSRMNYLNLGREFLTQLFCDSPSNFDTWYSRTILMKMLLLAHHCSVFTLSYINDPTALICVFSYSLAYGSIFCGRVEKMISCPSLIFLMKRTMFSDFLSDAKMLLEHIP